MGAIQSAIIICAQEFLCAIAKVLPDH